MKTVFYATVLHPGLPADYLAAIDKSKPGAKTGTCLAAGTTGKMIITSDFYTDKKWAKLGDLTLPIGYVGARNMRIKDEQGKVPGTFSTYFRKKRLPSIEEVEGIKLLSEISARVHAFSY